MITNYKETANILFVDDNQGDILLIKEAFAFCNIEVNISVADNGEDALNMFKRNGEYSTYSLPSLAFFDINVPKISGLELLKIVKEDHLLRHIPIIILTNAKTKSDILNSYSMYANAYIIKPNDLDGFIRLTQSINDFWLKSTKLP